MSVLLISDGSRGSRYSRTRFIFLFKLERFPPLQVFASYILRLSPVKTVTSGGIQKVWNAPASVVIAFEFFFDLDRSMGPKHFYHLHYVHLPSKSAPLANRSVHVLYVPFHFIFIELFLTFTCVLRFCVTFSMYL